MTDFDEKQTSKYLFSFYSEFGLDKDLETHINKFKLYNDQEILDLTNKLY